MFGNNKIINLLETVMMNGLQTIICKILGETQNSERTEQLLTYLTRKGVKNVDDLEYLDKECLEKLGILSNDEIYALMNSWCRELHATSCTKSQYSEILQKYRE